ncbi:MAG TPA: peptidoglycan DD-metalloendopeptidase family protein [Acidimicrobiales bacterium]|nr:peptidoglycan DD-metalloendopeptidase family protein [Acidimicrobiales bacterium]
MLASLLVAAVAAVSVSYVPPADELVVDGFRPPTSSYGAGNRGIDYATDAGEVIRAAADGAVVFAGRIGSASHVVVLHDDGIRTSYSFLADTDVRRGDRVAQGDTVGTAAGPVHFGARAGDEYLDPTVLFGGGPPQVHLVPADQRHPLHEWEERRDLLDVLRGGGRAVVDAVSPAAHALGGVTWEAADRALRRVSREWTRLDEGVRAWAHAINAPLTHDERVARRVERVVDDQRDCTPADVPPPSAPGRDRIAVLVAGLNSTMGGGAVMRIDTGALGYLPERVVQYSYVGGQAEYDARDTHQDIRISGDRLRALLQDIARTHPGVPVDLIAHSQGGLVVRAAVTGADHWDPTMPTIANVVTLGTPHHGAVAATAANAIGVDRRVARLFEVAEGLGAPTGRSTQQLASSSHLIDELHDVGLPAGATVTSIAASGDLLVDAQMSAIDDATNVVVPVAGGILSGTAHDALPGAPATARELALALGGRGPTCRDLGPDLELVDAVNLANTVTWVSDRLGRLVHSLPAPGGIRPPG